jgi:hypothetical protein
MRLPQQQMHAAAWQIPTHTHSLSVDGRPPAARPHPHSKPCPAPPPLPPLQDLGQGVLFYGDIAGGGTRASEWVQELHSREDLQQFVDSKDEEVRSAALRCGVTHARPAAPQLSPPLPSCSPLPSPPPLRC